MIRSFTLSESNREDGVTANDEMVFDTATLTCHLIDNGLLTELEILEVEGYWNKVVVRDNLPLAFICTKSLGAEGRLLPRCNETLVITLREY